MNRVHYIILFTVAISSLILLAPAGKNLRADTTGCNDSWYSDQDTIDCIRSIDPASSVSVAESSNLNFVLDMRGFDERTIGVRVFTIDTEINSDYQDLLDAEIWDTDALKDRSEALCRQLVGSCTASSATVAGSQEFEPSTYTFADVDSPEDAQARFDNIEVENQSTTLMIACYSICDCGLTAGPSEETPIKEPYYLAEKLNVSAPELCQGSLEGGEINGRNYSCLVQNFPMARIPNVSLPYIGVPANEAETWSPGDRVEIGEEVFTIQCIRIAGTINAACIGGWINTASFDMVLLDRMPVSVDHYPGGTPVFRAW